MTNVNAGSMYPPGFSCETDPASAHYQIADLPPHLRMILVADGTITKLIEAFCWEHIDVRVLGQEVEMGTPSWGGAGSPQAILQRNVTLVSSTQGPQWSRKPGPVRPESRR